MCAAYVTGPHTPAHAVYDLAFTDGNSRPIIGDRNERTAIPSDLHSHPTGFTAIFDRIVDEVRHSIEQKIPIARYEYTLIHGGSEMRMLVFRGCIEELHDLACDLR